MYPLDVKRSKCFRAASGRHELVPELAATHDPPGTFYNFRKLNLCSKTAINKTAWISHLSKS